jgi:4-amino-4-deoxy-L-arabinose transferase-like glycosyltransferase
MDRYARHKVDAVDNKWPQRIASVVLTLAMVYLGWALCLVIPPLIRSYGGWSFIWLLCLSFGLIIFVYGSMSNVRSIVPVCIMAFFVYVLVALYFDTRPFSDFENLYIRVKNFTPESAGSVILQSKSPVTVLYYGFLHWIMGGKYIAIYGATALLWSLQIFFLYQILYGLGGDHRRALLATVIFGSLPSVIAYAGVLSTESVFLALILASWFFIVIAVKKEQLVWLIPAGMACGLAQITRSNSIIFFIGIILFVVLTRTQWTIFRRGVSFLIILLSFLSCLLVYSTANTIHHGRFSASVSPWKFNLLVGTNQSSAGQWNTEDLGLAGYGNSSLKYTPEAEARAFWIARYRMTRDPFQFLKFGLTTKIRGLWENDRFGISWSAGQSSKQTEFEYLGILHVFPRFGDAWYLVVLFCAWLGLSGCWLRGISGRSPTEAWGVCLFLIPLLLTGLIHVFIEVKPRYHLVLMPILSYYAAGVFVALWESRLMTSISGYFSKTG